MKTQRSSKSLSITGDASLLPVFADEASLSTLRSHTGLLSRAWEWLQARHVTRSSTRRLRVAETVSLGEKRFVAVVQVDGRHFLLAGGPTNIVLLAQLDEKDAFEDVLKKTLTVPAKQAPKRKRSANVVLQTQEKRTNRLADLSQKTAAAGGKQPAKAANKQDGATQRAVGASPITHLNGTEDFGDVLQKTMSARRQTGKQPRKQNFKTTAAQTGYFA
jgi:flagellar biogenesis protein FliO